eukprot:9803-Heterococcus_DN1.PRE.1
MAACRAGGTITNIALARCCCVLLCPFAPLPRLVQHSQRPDAECQPKQNSESAHRSCCNAAPRGQSADVGNHAEASVLAVALPAAVRAEVHALDAVDALQVVPDAPAAGAPLQYILVGCAQVAHA